MRITRSILATFLIAGGLAGAFAIVRGSVPPVQSPDVVAQALNAVAKADPVQLIPTPPLDAIQEPSSNNASVPNLTFSLGASLLDQLHGLDFSNPEVTNDPSRYAASISEKSFEQVLGQVSALPATPSLAGYTLNVIDDASREAKITYMNDLAEVGAEYFPALEEANTAFEDVYKKRDVTSSLRLAEQFKAALPAYAKIAVPREWEDSHRALLLYFAEGEILFRTLAQYPDDPMKGYVGISLFQEFMGSTASIYSTFVHHAQAL